MASSGIKKRGFASLTQERRREIASAGGRAAHAKGTGHRWTPEQAQEAGKKGGEMGRGDSKRRNRE